jgi:hypothetical protein
MSDLNVLSAERRLHFVLIEWRREVNVYGKRMRVEDGSVQQHHRRQRQFAAGDSSVVIQNPKFSGARRWCHVVTVSTAEVKRNLCPEDVHRQLLEGQKVHSLVVKFVHSPLSVLGRGLADHSRDIPDFTDLLHS